MIKIDYDIGKAIVDSCTCECGGLLSLPWGGAYGVDSYVIICANDLSHDTVVPVKSLTQMWKEGTEIPYFIKSHIENKHKEEIMEQESISAMVVKADTTKLTNYVRARFPRDLERPESARDFAIFCISHGLEPIRDCVPFQGAPYICVEWLDRQAAADSQFKGYNYEVFTREKKEALVFDPMDLVIECHVKIEGLDHPLVGLGVVTLDEREQKTERGTYRSPIVAKHAQQMAFKRARSAALKQRYHIPAPILEELPYTTVIDAEYRVLHDETITDKNSPEVVSVIAEPTKSYPANTGHSEGGVGEDISETTKGENSTKKMPRSAARRTSDQIKKEDVSDGFSLEKVANEVWGLQPGKLWPELNYLSARNFKEAGVETAWDCFLKLKVARG